MTVEIADASTMEASPSQWGVAQGRTPRRGMTGHDLLSEGASFDSEMISSRLSQQALREA